MSRIQWEQKVLGDDGLPTFVKTTAYMTTVPGLVVYRRPGGWYVGHLPTGTVVNNYPVPKQEDATRLVDHFRDLTDWATVSLEMPEGTLELTLLELRDAVQQAELQFLAMKAWERCDENECLRVEEHPGTHQNAGRRWRRT
jgi:hypothetical protein